jgi:CBS domain-containing protein
MPDLPMRVLVAIRATLETFRMRAMDLMTTEVITVDENASIQSVAKLLADHGISALRLWIKRIG